MGHVAAEAKPRLGGTGGLPDDLWRINVKRAGRHPVRDGLLTPDDRDDCLADLDNPGFVEVRYVGIAAWGEKPPA